MTTERPILFSTPMVRAILAGQKTQTRRVVKPQPVEDPPGYLVQTDRRGLEAGAPTEDAHWWFNCPYGAAGDLLWVRETWAVDADLETTRAAHEDVMSGMGYGPYYKADKINDKAGMQWRPSIFMPRWASRLTLRITEVRVERVQEISEADAIAEGCKAHKGHYWRPLGSKEQPYPVTARVDFWGLWDEINAKRGFGWSVNPWVWCISFEVLK